MLQHAFIRFILVGILNTVFGYSMFSLFIHIGFHYGIAVLFSTILGVLFNFKTFGKLVFNNTNHRLIYKFILTYCVLYVINVSLIKASLFFISNIYISGAIGSVLTAIFSYFLNAKWVFKLKAKERLYEIN